MGLLDRFRGGTKQKSLHSHGAFARLFSDNVSWSKSQCLKAYEISTYVYAAVSKRAQKVGQIKFVIFKQTPDGEVEVKVKDSPILQLLNNPNSFQSKNEFFELYESYKDLCGSTYVWLMGGDSTTQTPYTEMQLLRPDYISRRFISKETGEIVSYEYKTPSGKIETISADDLIVSHFPNPSNQHEGQSPLVAGALSVDTERQLSTYQNTVLQNGGKVEGIINFKDAVLDESQIQRIKDMFKKQYAGSKNSGKPLVTHGAMEYQNIALTPTELSYLESKKMTRDDILLIYGVPKVILAQSDDVNRATAETAKSVFLSETIRPLLENIVEKFGQKLVTDENERLWFVDPTPEDVERTLKEIETGVKNFYMTTNEARRLAKLPPIEGGDVILQPATLLPTEADVIEKSLDEISGIKKKLNSSIH